MSTSSSMHATPSEFLKDVDEQLEPLLDTLRSTIRDRSRTVLIGAWERVNSFPLLPFHLQLRWAGILEPLPLNPRIGIIPFFANDYLLASTPLYDIADVIRRRKEARVSRASLRQFAGDITMQDWETRVERRISKLKALLLPAASFIAIDQVTQEGEIVAGHRSVLGRIAARGAPRPSVLVPVKRGLSRKAVRSFSEIDLILVNVQGISGRRAIASVRILLEHCAHNVPILVVASSPSDLLPFADELTPNGTHLSFTGPLPHLNSVSVTSVGRDRPSVEREFEFAIQGLEEEVPQLGIAVQLAKYAWWTARQALHEFSDAQPEMRKFLLAYDRTISDFPIEAGRLTAAKQLLCREAGNREIRRERCEAVVNAVLTAPGAAETLVLVRDEEEAQALRIALAKCMEIAPESLKDFGVHVTGRRGYWPDRKFSAAIAAGYFGARTLDALIASRAPVLRFVLDPIEARATWFQLKKASELLRSAGAADAQTVLQMIADKLSHSVAAFGDIVDVSLDISALGQRPEQVGSFPNQPSSPENVIVTFADGSAIETSKNARFEVLREAGKRLKTLKATELESGDQVVVLLEDSRTLFSEQLLAALDNGPLADQAQKRATWLSVVQSVYLSRGTSVQSIARSMQEQGQSVDVTTVRTWLKADGTEEASIPDRLDRFQSFAAALGIALPPEVLLDLYTGIQNCRVNHRKFGRALVRAVRAACLGRLDAPTLRKIESEWGLNARELVEGARVAIVDEVILPGYRPCL